MHKFQREEQRWSAAWSGTVKVERERIRSVCVRVMPGGCLISAAGEVKSGHKSHPQTLPSPLNLHNSWATSVSLLLSLSPCVFPSLSLLSLLKCVCSNVCWPKSGVALAQEDVMQCNGAQLIIWSAQTFYGSGRYKKKSGTSVLYCGRKKGLWFGLKVTLDQHLNQPQKHLRLPEGQLCQPKGDLGLPKEQLEPSKGNLRQQDKYMGQPEEARGSILKNCGHLAQRQAWGLDRGALG